MHSIRRESRKKKKGDVLCGCKKRRGTEEEPVKEKSQIENNFIYLKILSKLM